MIQIICDTNHPDFSVVKDPGCLQTINMIDIYYYGIWQIYFDNITYFFEQYFTISDLTFSKTLSIGCVASILLKFFNLLPILRKD